MISPAHFLAPAFHRQLADILQRPGKPTSFSASARNGSCRDYSYRSDSVGCNCAARSAGKYPKNTPTEHDTRNANTTDSHGTGTLIYCGSHGRAITGMATAIRIPNTDPNPLIMNASSKN